MQPAHPARPAPGATPSEPCLRRSAGLMSSAAQLPGCTQLNAHLANMLGQLDEHIKRSKFLLSQASHGLCQVLSMLNLLSHAPVVVTQTCAALQVVRCCCSYWQCTGNPAPTTPSSPPATPAQTAAPTTTSTTPSPAPTTARPATSTAAPATLSPAPPTAQPVPSTAAPLPATTAAPATTTQAPRTSTAGPQPTAALPTTPSPVASAQTLAAYSQCGGSR